MLARNREQIFFSLKDYADTKLCRCNSLSRYYSPHSLLLFLLEKYI